VVVPFLIHRGIDTYSLVKPALFSVLLPAVLLTGCVLPEPTVYVRQPAPVYVHHREYVRERQPTRVYAYQPGYVVHTLPTGYHRTVYGHSIYYVSHGVYYSRSSRGYVVVRRPY